MHKRLLNELTLALTFAPDGPLLIKAGDRGGMDPTRPDMEFVRTWHNGRETVYLPGSSLKGMLRAHCEKIARTVASAASGTQMATRLSCNPLSADAKAADGGCGEKFSRWLDKSWNTAYQKPLTAETVYRNSCFVCQLFGNTALASHVRITDAYPSLEQAIAQTPAAQSLGLPTNPTWAQLDERGRRLLDPNLTEERHGVAIDRVYGSVAVGPFQFETATQGVFAATLTVRNFTTAQLGLLGLALRDLRQQQVSIGFAKSRGLGRIKVTIAEATFRYPLGDLLPNLPAEQISGVGALLSGLDEQAAQAYGYAPTDQIALAGRTLQGDGWGGQQIYFDAAAATPGGALDEIWKAGVNAWKRVVQDGR